MHWDFDERAGCSEAAPVRLSRLPLSRGRRRGRAARPPTTSRSTPATRPMPDEHAGTFRHVGPALERGVEPRPPLRAVRHAGAVPRHADPREGAVPRRLVRRLAGDDGRVRRAGADRAGAARLRRGRRARYWPDGRVNAVYPNGDGRRDIPDATETYVEWVWQCVHDDRRPRAARDAVSGRAPHHRLRRTGRSTRRRDSSRTCPAAAATTSTASSTGRRRCATATT